MKYPIKVVVRETGLTAHVLRVWEKRYAAVVPERTATQRRTYSDADVYRLKLLRRATLLGHPIGSVAELSGKELETLVQSASAQAQTPSASGIDNGTPIWNSLVIRECIEAVKIFDADALTAVLEREAVQSGHTALLRHVIVPLAHRLGDLWSEGILRMSNEHFATAVIRSFLLNPARKYAGANASSTLVAATPQGQLHELGAVIAAALAAELGWRVVYLGPSLPAAEIAGVAFQNQARAVALSIVYPDDDPNIERELYDLRRFLPKTVATLVGGRAAESYHAAIDATGAILVKDLAQLQIELAQIRATRP